MLPLFTLTNEPGLRLAAVRLVVAGALGAVGLPLLAAGWPELQWLQRLAGHWPVALAGGTGLLLALPAAAGRTDALRAGALAALGLGLLAAIAQRGWTAATLVYLPDPPGLALLGAASGLALVLALLPLFGRLRPFRLWWAARAADPAGLDPADPLVARALALWPRIERGDPAPEVRRALAVALARLLVVTRRWRQLGTDHTVPAGATLVAEREALVRWQQGSIDPVARVRYAEAQRSLDVQVQHLAAIAASRERMRAQLHRQLEAMEALHLASVTARTAAADRGTETWRPLLDELGRLGDELDAAREVAADPALLK